MNKKFYRLILAFLCVTSSLLMAVPFDNIVAVVDKEIILKSDLDEMLAAYKSQPMFENMNEEQQYGFLLEKMIDEKIMLAVAERDTNIEVTVAEVDAAMNNYLQQIMEQNGGEFQFEAILKQTRGMTLGEFKKQIREQIRQQRLKQKLQEKYLGQSDPTHLQVQKFYKEYKDSLPKLQNNFLLSHLEYSVNPNKELLQKAYKKCDSIIKLLDKGADFAQMAKSHSDDPSRAEGGDLGFVKRGTLDPDYEKYAFRLRPGAYTRVPVRTPFGFHIIKLTEQKDIEIRTSHILFRVQPTEQDTIDTYKYLDSLRQVILKEGGFKQIAFKLTEDKNTKPDSGSLGWFTEATLNNEYKAIVDTLEEGQITEPILIDGKFHLFKLDKKLSERELTLEDDWEQISMLAKNHLFSQRLDIFLEKWRQEVHVENLSNFYVKGDPLIFKSEEEKE